MNLLDFSGKSVLVVGGSSGIGNGIAQAFRSQGAEVYVWGRRPEAGDYIGQSGTNLTGLHYQQIDVSDLQAIADYQPPFDRLDVLVTCQGKVEYGRKEFEMETFQDVLQVNLNSVMACCMKFEQMLEASGGSAVVVGSLAAYHSSIGNPAYVASKAGVHGLVMTLGETWAKAGVRINAIAPGLVDTNLTKVTTEHPERLQRQLKKIPLGRVGTPQDMAGPVLFLASDLAGYVTGQTLIVDGGRILP